MNSELKNTWLTKIEKVEQYTVSSGSGWFTIRTELYNAPEEIRLDEEITMKALLQSQEFVWNIHDNFRTDKNFILKLINLEEYKQDIYKGLKYDLKKDPEIFQKCIARDKDFSYIRIPKNICLDKELFSEALKKFNLAKIVEEYYKYDKEINFLLFSHHPGEWKSIPKSMQNFLIKERKFLIQAVKDFNHYSKIPKKMKFDLEVIEAALLSDVYNFNIIPNEISNDKNFILKIINKYKNNRLTHLISEKYPHFLNDLDIVKEMVSIDGNIMVKLNEEFTKNKELAILSIPTFPNYKYSSIHPELKKDKDIVELFLKFNLSRNYSEVPKEFITKEHSLKILKLSLDYYYDFPEHIKNDFDFNLDLVKLNHKTFLYLNEEFTKNIEFIYEYYKKTKFIDNKIKLNYSEKDLSSGFQHLISLMYKDAFTAKLEREQLKNNLTNKAPTKKLKI